MRPKQASLTELVWFHWIMAFCRLADQLPGTNSSRGAVHDLYARHETNELCICGVEMIEPKTMRQERYRKVTSVSTTWLRSVRDS